MNKKGGESLKFLSGWVACSLTLAVAKPWARDVQWCRNHPGFFFLGGGCILL